MCVTNKAHNNSRGMKTEPMLSLVSLAYRMPCAEILQPALQTGVPSVKWMQTALQLGGPCAEALHRTL